MALGVGSTGMQLDGTDGVHDVGLLACLGLVDKEEHLTVLLRAKTAEHIQGDLLHDERLVPGGPPKKFAVVGSVRRASEGFGQSIDGRPVADGDGHDQRPEVFPRPSGKVVLDRFEETMQFSGHFADGNHTASPTIIVCAYKCYRLKRPFLFGAYSHHGSDNRSV